MRRLDPLTAEGLRKVGAVVGVSVLAVIAFVMVAGPWLGDQAEVEQPRLSPSEVETILDAIEREVVAIPPFDGAHRADTAQSNACPESASTPTVEVVVTYEIQDIRRLPSRAILDHYKRELEQVGWRTTSSPGDDTLVLASRMQGEGVRVFVHAGTSPSSGDPPSYDLVGRLTERVCPSAYG